MKSSTAAIIDAVAANQHGIAGRQQLIAGGLTTAQVNHLLRSGALVVAAPNVYRVAGSPTTWLQRLQGALLACGPGAVASHRSAAHLLGLDGFRTPSAIEITIDRRRHLAIEATVHATRRLPRVDRTVAGGFPVTSAARTVIDLAAAGATATELGNAIDSAARLGLATGEFVSRRLALLGRRGRRGVGLLDQVTLDNGGHSFLERRLLRLVRRAELPRPRTQVVHRADGRIVARVDFEWSAEWLIVEVNGRRGHSSDIERAKDARRRNELQARGFRVVEFTTSQVLDEAGYVIATIGAHLGRAFVPDVPPKVFT